MHADAGSLCCALGEFIDVPCFGTRPHRPHDGNLGVVLGLYGFLQQAQKRRNPDPACDPQLSLRGRHPAPKHPIGTIDHHRIARNKLVELVCVITHHFDRKPDVAWTLDTRQRKRMQFSGYRCLAFGDRKKDELAGNCREWCIERNPELGDTVLCAALRNLPAGMRCIAPIERNAVDPGDSTNPGQQRNIPIGLRHQCMRTTQQIGHA